ncbi:MAG: hypothetical protein H6652_00230 [Ardenticatenaceae bacterium]|nr:hypothetical protein [Ardenticatenaceae bacterium]
MVEAEGKFALSNLHQVKKYARDLGVAYAYTTNGRHIIKWDMFSITTLIRWSAKVKMRLFIKLYGNGLRVSENTGRYYKST